MKKTKIVCTIGPSSWTKDKLTELAYAGMNIARLNFSHGTHDEKKEQIEIIRQVEEETGLPISILADLQGPKLRLGDIDEEMNIETDQKIILSKENLSHTIPTQVDLSDVVKKGERILVNDGLVELIVEEISGNEVHTIAKNNGVISSHKGINIPDSNYNKEIQTDKDKEDLEFAIQQNVDFVALSFVRNGNDIKNIRNQIQKMESDCKIIAKIEKKEAVANLQDIVLQADGVMVARGDLAIETSAAEVPIIQLQIIGLARQNQKPVIVATQMLESMINNPRPTRAEASDVANAVLYQVDAVMLSAESAHGKYPVETVQTMTNIINKVEETEEYKHYIKINWETIEEHTLRISALAKTAASLAYRIHAKCVAVATATGKTARVISSFRPSATIIAVAHDKQVQHQLNLLWGVTPLILKPIADSDLFEKEMIKYISSLKIANKGDKVVFIGGSRVGTPGMTDTIRVATA